MPPVLALALTLVFILALFKWDSKIESYTPSSSLWIPSIWLLLLGSRPVSLWFTSGEYVQAGEAADALMEGSPLDRQLLGFIIFAGVVVLFKRRVSLVQVCRDNPWLMAYYVYCAVSILWSDFPYISFKRWIKGLGDPIMALIVATETQPSKAFEALIKRCGFILLPFSILLIKYYPHLGRAFEYYSGAMSYTGVTTDKNMLGFQCLVAGLVAVYKVFVWRTKAVDSRKISELVVPFALLWMSQWLLWTANSKTPTVSLIFGVCLIALLGYTWVRQNLSIMLLSLATVYGILELTVGITRLIIESAGRDPTLTGRTDLWAVVLAMDDQVLFGYGFESFWLGDRLLKLWDLYFFKPIQAHNGYIEIYLNLGVMGLVLVVGLFISCYKRIQKMLSIPLSPETSEQLVFDRFRLAFLLGFLIYNVTEAGIKSLHFMFVILLMVIVHYRRQASSRLPHASFAQVGRPDASFGRVVRGGRSW